MKLFKKSLIITSTLALALMASGCTKKNVLIKNGYISKVASTSKYNTLNLRNEIIAKTYSVKNDRFLSYTTSSDEYVLYDYIMDKEVFKTNDKVYSLNFSNSSTTILVTYDDDDRTQELRLTNGDVLVPRGKYISLQTSEIKTKNNGKEKDFMEVYFTTRLHTVGSFETKYYKISFKGIKNANKTLVLDKDPKSYTVTQIDEKEASIYKAGDKVISDYQYFTYQVDGDNIIFYDSYGSRDHLVFTKNGGNVVCHVNGNTGIGILQLYKQTTNTNFDVSQSGTNYLVDTYKVDVKNGTYERIDFNYFIKGCSISSIKDNIIINKANVVKDNVIYNTANIVLDKNLKVIQDSARYAFGTYYRDLGNGNYITSYDNLTYITDGSGIIKKIIPGNYEVLVDAKVIAITYNNRLSFIDFKGNYITDDILINSGSFESVSGNQIYYETYKDAKSHLASFSKGSFVDDVEIEYSFISAEASISNIMSANDKDVYNSYNYGYYYVAEKHDNNNDTLFDDFTLTFYDREKNALFGSIERIFATNYRHISSDSEGNACNFYIAFKNNDADTVAIQFYIVK